MHCDKAIHIVMFTNLLNQPLPLKLQRYACPSIPWPRLYPFPLALFGPQIVYIKVQLIALIHMTLGLPRSSIDVVNRVLVERVLMSTVQDVIQSRRMS
jgi:hypothetical protein